jgi:hypothetical protein
MLQNYKATRPCQAGLPPDLGVKQAKGLSGFAVSQGKELLYCTHGRVARCLCGFFSFPSYVKAPIVLQQVVA